MRMRLKAPCFINNHRYRPGEIVTLPDGIKGPHRTVRQADAHFFGRDLTAADYQKLAAACDEPLYEELPE